MGDFSTGTMGIFAPALTQLAKSPNMVCDPALPPQALAGLREILDRGEWVDRVNRQSLRKHKFTATIGADRERRFDNAERDDRQGGVSLSKEVS